MKVYEVMTSNIETIEAGETVLDAAEKMADRNIGCLPVLLAGDVIGFVTDRDIVVRAVARGLSAEKTPISDVMTRKAITCREDWDLRDAARAMEDENVRRLAVLDDEGALCGLLSLDDLALRAHDSKTAGEVLEHAALPPNPPRVLDPDNGVGD